MKLRLAMPSVVQPGVAERCNAYHSKGYFMSIRRQPAEIWNHVTRPRIWRRDRGQCVRCLHLGIHHVLSLESCHIDHIQSGRRGSNADDNLRVLCRLHHVLREDIRHRGMIGGALKQGLIPPNWRELLW